MVPRNKHVQFINQTNSTATKQTVLRSNHSTVYYEPLEGAIVENQCKLPEKLNIIVV